MLEEFFANARAIARHRAGIFGPYIDDFAARLSARGYARRSTRFDVWAVSRFGRWLAEHNLTSRAVSEKTIDEFGDTQRHSCWARKGDRAALCRLLEQLRSLGVAPAAAPKAECSAAERLAGEFGQYRFHRRPHRDGRRS